MNPEGVGGQLCFDDLCNIFRFGRRSQEYFRLFIRSKNLGTSLPNSRSEFDGKGPPQLGMLISNPYEFRLGNPIDHGIGRRYNARRSPSRRVDQGHLSDVVPGAAHRDLAPIDAHLCLAAYDEGNPVVSGVLDHNRVISRDFLQLSDISQLS